MQGTTEMTLDQYGDAVDPHGEIAGEVPFEDVLTNGGAFSARRFGGKTARPLGHPMNFVLMALPKEPRRAYYAGAYVHGQRSRPACSSANGTTPDDDVAAPVAAACASCPFAQTGSKAPGTRNMDTKCTRFYFLAVADPNDPHSILRFKVKGNTWDKLLALGQSLPQTRGCTLADSAVMASLKPYKSNFYVEFDFAGVLPADMRALVDDSRNRNTDAIAAALEGPPIRRVSDTPQGHGYVPVEQATPVPMAPAHVTAQTSMAPSQTAMAPNPAPTGVVMPTAASAPPQSVYDRDIPY